MINCHASWGVGGVLVFDVLGRDPFVDKPLKSVTSPAAEHHRRLTDTELHCLVTEAHVREQLARGC